MDAPGDPPRPTHKEILEKEYARTDHVIDVLPRCQCIVELGHASINKWVFSEGSKVKGILDTTMEEAQRKLQYKRQLRYIRLESDILTSE